MEVDRKSSIPIRAIQESSPKLNGDNRLKLNKQGKRESIVSVLWSLGRQEIVTGLAIFREQYLAILMD
jgi:hypothetical protein